MWGKVTFSGHFSVNTCHVANNQFGKVIPTVDAQSVVFRVKIYPLEKCVQSQKSATFSDWTLIDMLQWNLSWETTALRDHLSWQTRHFWQKDLHFNITEPVTRDHLSWQTTFLWPMGWSFNWRQVLLYSSIGNRVLLLNLCRNCPHVCHSKHKNIIFCPCSSHLLHPSILIMYM